MNRLFLFVILLAFLTSCSTTYRVNYSQQQLDSYVGKTHQELVQRLGAPISDISDGADGYILTFEGNRELFYYTDRYVSNTSTLPKAQFFMNSNGVCYRVKTANTDPVRVTSVGGTIALVILILIIL